MMLNVMDFGAIGDGVADDRAAIQAAINQASVGPETRVFIPGTSAHYKVGAPLLVNKVTNGGVKIEGDGYASEVRGNFEGFVLDRYPSTVATSGPYSIEHIKIRNTHVLGSGVRLTNFIGGVLSRLVVQANKIGISGELNTFGLSVESCRVISAGCPTGSVGILAGGHSDVRLCDVAGWDEGAGTFGVNSNVCGCRIKVNRTGIFAGKNAAGLGHATSRSAIDGNSFEANDIAINLDHVGECFVAANGIQGSANAPSGMSRVGIKLRAVAGLVLAASSARGAFSEVAIAFDPHTAPVRTAVMAVSGLHTGPGQRWILPNDASGLQFVQCDQAV